LAMGEDRQALMRAQKAAEPPRPHADDLFLSFQ
jgi:hypothetical protein